MRLRHFAEDKNRRNLLKKLTKQFDNPRNLRIHLSRFIIAKPDPLVEVISSALREGSPFDEDGSHDYTAEAKVIAAAIEARGLEIVEKKP